jgi:hypothetical protein
MRRRRHLRESKLMQKRGPEVEKGPLRVIIKFQKEAGPTVNDT